MDKPIFQEKNGLVSVSVFERDAEGKNGLFKSQSVVLQLSYNKDNEWIRNDLTIVKSNLKPVIQALKSAEVFIYGSMGKPIVAR